MTPEVPPQEALKTTALGLAMRWAVFLDLQHHIAILQSHTPIKLTEMPCLPSNLPLVVGELRRWQLLGFGSITGTALSPAQCLENSNSSVAAYRNRVPGLLHGCLQVEAGGMQQPAQLVVAA